MKNLVQIITKENNSLQMSAINTDLTSKGVLF